MIIPHRETPPRLWNCLPQWEGSMEGKQYKWKDKKQAYGDALAYLRGRMRGEIKSFQTPFTNMNEAGAAGIEYGTTVIIAGRPGSYKSTLKDLIFNRAKEFNPEERFNILDIQLEMQAKVTAIREFSSVTQTSYKDLCSSYAPLDMEVLKKCYNHANKRVLDKSFGIDTIEDSPTTLEFKDIVEEYMEVNKNKETGEYTKTLIGIDHTRLFKRDSFDRTEEEMISSMSKMFTYLKRKYPIIFFVLSQLNRDIERPERNEDRKQGNYPTSSDIFASDSLFQAGDIVIILNRPSLKNIRYYGSNGFIIDNEGILAAHYIKCRNGDTRLTFMQADGATMNITEIEPPVMSASNIKRIPAPLPQQHEAKMKDLKPNDLFTNQQTQ